MGDPLGGRELQEVPGLEDRHQDRAAGRLHHGEEHRDEARDVGRGHRQQRTVPRPEVHGERVVQHRMDDVEMGQQRALGSPGRAGGVEDDRDVLLRGLVRGWRRRAAREQRLEDGRTGGAADHEAVRELRQILRLGQALRQRRLVDQDLGAALRQHVAQPRGLLAQAERRRDRADLESGEHGDQELRPVAEEERDPVAGREAVGGEPGRGAPDQLLQLSIGEARGARDQGLALGVARDRRREQGRQVGRPLGEAAHQPVAEMPLVADRGQRILGPGHGAQPRRSASGGVR